ncbi:hypothetical protein PF011_g4753 [Phytophthora fragariae]|uniref:Uncharacterized protein n=1 Tax=Phytophthora fragariae TaxID=53985 RepID=A0A6A3LRC8_9STRA|nr:hypothetical protein PF011_g4753 [Phytophthora fragariae]
MKPARFLLYVSPLSAEVTFFIITFHPATAPPPPSKRVDQCGDMVSLTGYTANACCESCSHATMTRCARAVHSDDTMCTVVPHAAMTPCMQTGCSGDAIVVERDRPKSC